MAVFLAQIGTTCASEGSGIGFRLQFSIYQQYILPLVTHLAPEYLMPFRERVIGVAEGRVMHSSTKALPRRRDNQIVAGEPSPMKVV